MDDLVHVVDVELAGSVALDRLRDVLDETPELGLGIGRDERVKEIRGIPERTARASS